MNFLKYVCIFLSSLVLVSCSGGPDQTNIELIQDMMSGPQIKTQEGGPGDLATVRMPPKGTVARGYKPYTITDVSKADALVNPKETLTAEELIKFENSGPDLYRVYCGVCHGEKGRGDGPIAGKMLKRPPDLTTSVYNSYTDGRLYHVVTAGWGLMGSYASQIPDPKERWAVVSYVRQLQISSKGGN